MKKSLLLATLLMGSTMMFSQKKAVNDANAQITKAQEFRLLQRNSEALELIQKAQTALDGAINDPSTSAKYDTWMSRAIAYSLYGQLEPSKGAQYFAIAKESLFKAYELDPKKTAKYDNILELISNLAFNYYNLGVTSMNEAKYKDAQSQLTSAYDVLDFDNGKLLPKNTLADTVKLQSNYYAGLCAYYAEDYKGTIELLDRAINHPITAGEVNAYITLANAYAKTNNKSKQLETINKGKSKFPNDPNIATAEINYYIESGELETVTKKINEELAQNPNRDDLYYNLGLIDIELIKKGVKNEDEEIAMYNKAFEHFKKASDIKSDIKYDYVLGLSAFNAGAIYNNRIQKVFDEKEQLKIEKDRNVYFEKAQSYYLKIHNHYSSKDKSKLTNSDLSIWQESLKALKSIALAYNNEADYKKYNDLIQNL